MFAQRSSHFFAQAVVEFSKFYIFLIILILIFLLVGEVYLFLSIFLLFKHER